MGDLIRGMLLVLFIVCLAGAIAYVGDRVGHQVGRKRLSLFGIRPRYTSTIVAIGTGMLIALVVTLGAVFANNSVKTAFFHLNAVNTRVTQLQAQADELERHTRNEQVIVGVGDLISPEIVVINKDASLKDRTHALQQYYDHVAAFANASLVPRGLKAILKPRAEVDKLIRQNVSDVELTSALTQSKVVMIAIADQNLFQNDPIHFALRAIRDIEVFPRNVTVASFVVPADPTNNVQFVLSQLEELVTQGAVKNGMPFVFAQNVKIIDVRPSAESFQRALTGHGLYKITASSVGDVYPELTYIPVSISISPK